MKVRNCNLFSDNTSHGRRGMPSVQIFTFKRTFRSFEPREVIYQRCVGFTGKLGHIVCISESGAVYNLTFYANIRKS